MSKSSEKCHQKNYDNLGEIIHWTSQFFELIVIYLCEDHNKVLLPLSRYHYINILFFISHWLAMSNSCYNPFIYAIYSVSVPNNDMDMDMDKRCKSLTVQGIQILPYP